MSTYHVTYDFIGYQESRWVTCHAGLGTVTPGLYAGPGVCHDGAAAPGVAAAAAGIRLPHSLH